MNFLSFKYISFFLGFLLAVTLISCQSRNLVKHFPKSEGSDFVSLAVLPYDIAFTGSGREHMSEQFLEEQTAVKAEAFQQDLVSEIARRASNRLLKNVQIQAPEETNARLRTLGIKLVDAQHKSPGELVSALGVDAIVMGNVRLNSNYRNAGTFLGRYKLERAESFVPNDFEVAVRLSIVDKNGMLVFDDSSDNNCRNFSSVNDQVAVANRLLLRDLPSFR